jgi:serine phosphatase RsbU (regulator of sigma subunit)
MSRPRDELARQFFRTMPARAQAWFYLGVFCCFAPLGLITGTGSLRVPPALEVVLITIYSGGIAIGYAAAATRAPKWLVVPISLHLTVTVALRYWLPDRPQLLVLDAAQAEALRSWLITAGVLTVLSLAGAFTAFAALLRLEGLRFVAAHAEIRLAREIHATLVPAVEGRSALAEWRGSSRPSGDVGGDLVDVVSTGRGWTAVVADVSGHGVAAGVVMGMFKTAFRAALDLAPDVGAIATRVNAVLGPLRQPHMFVTAACVSMTRAGAIEFVLAGHPQLLHLSEATGRAVWVGEPGFALTLVDDVTYGTQILPVGSGDVVIVLTDGLLEVFDAHDRELGPDGVCRAVEAAGAAAPLDRIEAAILDACRRHGPQLDDQTLLLIRLR